MNFKQIVSTAVMTALALSLAGCAEPEQDTVTIAVIGNEADLYPGYKDGTEKAAEDARSEYEESGLDIEYEFYSYDGSYEEGAAIVDMLAADESVTAVIGAVDMELNKTAAHVFDSAGKIFVVPFFLYDSVFDDNHYSTVFSMCNSGQTVGEILRRAAAETPARRWAVCAADRDFEQSEMNGFLQYTSNDGIGVVDCVNIYELEKNFDGIYSRWANLGVEGVVIFAENEEGFELLRQIKRRSPSMVCAGDTAFDNTDITLNDAELTSAMSGFIMANEFIFNIETDEEMDRYIKFAEEYTAETGEELDLWYIQGYDAVRMIADTAVNENTADPRRIAGALHESGYSGLFQDLSFSANGKLAERDNVYTMFDAEGYAADYLLKDEVR